MEAADFELNTFFYYSPIAEGLDAILNNKEYWELFDLVKNSYTYEKRRCMADIYIILKLISIFLTIVTTVLSMAVPKRKICITLSFGFVSGFLMFLDFSNGVFLGVLIPGILGIFTSIFFAIGGLRMQNNARKSWEEYKLTHWR